MASISRLTSGKGTRWQARWRAPDGRQRAQRFDRKVDAERFLAQVEASKLKGAYVDPAAGRVLLKPYAEKWLANQVQHRESTRRQVAFQVRRHVIGDEVNPGHPTFGDRPLNSVLRSDVQSWVAALSHRVAPITARTIYSYLAAIFRAAVSDHLIPGTPCRDIQLPEVLKERVVPLTVAEVNAIAAAMPPRYRALVVVGATTGLRFGELAGLTVDRVDFLRRSLRVDRQYMDRTGIERGFAPPKTKSSVRTVPLSDTTIKALAAHLAEFPAMEPDGLIFHEGDRPLRRNAFAVIWHRAADPVRPGSSPHDLRHAYASLLIRHGADVKLVQARMGHTSATTTLDTYGHLWPDSDDRTRTAIDAAFDAAQDAAAGEPAEGVTGP